MSLLNVISMVADQNKMEKVARPPKIKHLKEEEEKDAFKRSFSEFTGCLDVMQNTLNHLNQRWSERTVLSSPHLFVKTKNELLVSFGLLSLKMMELKQMADEISFKIESVGRLDVVESQEPAKEKIEVVAKAPPKKRTRKPRSPRSLSYGTVGNNSTNGGNNSSNANGSVDSSNANGSGANNSSNANGGMGNNGSNANGIMGNNSSSANSSAANNSSGANGTSGGASSKKKNIFVSSEQIDPGWSLIMKELTLPKNFELSPYENR